MTRSYTHLKLNISEADTKLEEDYSTDMKAKIVTPSDAVIRNILNYSKALSAWPLKLTGNISLILLN
ncbi:MAG: hypothetical protein WCQ70_07350 [Lentimicrobiaceae bacterium]